MFYIVLFLLICLISIFGIKTVSSDKGSINISDKFLLLYFVKKMWKYLSEIRVSENCIDPKSSMVEKQDQTTFPVSRLNECVQ